MLQYKDLWIGRVVAYAPENDVAISFAHAAGATTVGDVYYGHVVGFHQGKVCVNIGTAVVNFPLDCLSDAQDV